MLFWKKQPAPAPPTSSQNDGGPDVSDVGYDALEALGALLRRLGEAGDVDDERQLLEAWAHHIVLQGPVPKSGIHLVRGRRDWRGVRTIVDEVLRGRASRAQRAIADLRDTVSAMTRTLSTAMREDNHDDTTISGELRRLKIVAEQRPPEEVKRTALAVVASLTAVLAERETRHQRRVQELQQRTAGLEGRLLQATRDKLEDVLTGLINRRGFEIELARTLHARQGGDVAALIIFDLDSFKRVNDTFGHGGGDLALKAFARTLSLCFPRHDDCVARYGGEEFVVLLRGVAVADAMRLADRCLERQRTVAVDMGAGAVVVTVSAGVTALREDDDAEGFIARADAALYRAKHAGRDRAIAG